jgi:hypothetical protein
MYSLQQCYKDNRITYPKSQTVSALPKLEVELGGALSQNERVVELGLGSSTTPLQTQLLELELNLGVGAVPNRP